MFKNFMNIKVFTNMNKMMKYYKTLNVKNMYFIIALIVMVSCSEKEQFNPFEHIENKAVITKWKGNKKAALTLEFDDSTLGQATLGVPALVKRNLIGTWYVNPGRNHYIQNKSYWETVAPNGGQELANHTMTHTGASTYEEVVYEVGEVSKIIWKIRGQEDYASLIAFNRGGGTSWNEEDLAKVLADFCNIDRQTKLGMPSLGKSVVAGSTSNQMMEIIPKILEDSLLGRLHFHGIAEKNGIPPMDVGTAGVWIAEFNIFLDKLKKYENQLWNAGFIQVFKYIKERQTSTLTVNKTSETVYSLYLDCSLDKKYYDEELTVILCVPKTWSACILDHNGNQKNLSVNNGFVMFDARPNLGQITLTKK